MQVGVELAEARQQLGLSLEDISSRTKISVERLVAIERGDVAQLPPLVYLNGFLRAYATEVHLDPDDIANRYLTAVEQHTPPPSPSPTGAPSEDPLDEFSSEADLGAGAALPAQPLEPARLTEEAHATARLAPAIEPGAEPLLTPTAEYRQDDGILRVTREALATSRDQREADDIFDREFPDGAAPAERSLLAAERHAEVGDEHMGARAPHMTAGAPPRRRVGSAIVVLAVAVVAGLVISANYDRLKSELDRARDMTASARDDGAADDPLRDGARASGSPPERTATEAAHDEVESTAGESPTRADERERDGAEDAERTGRASTLPSSRRGSAAPRGTSTAAPSSPGSRTNKESATAGATGMVEPRNAIRPNRGTAAATPPAARSTAPERRADTSPSAARPAAPSDPIAPREPPASPGVASSERPASTEEKPGLPARAMADRETAPGAREAGSRAAAPEDLSGWWTVTNRIESTSYRAYDNLNLGYRVRLEQNGDRVTGTGQKWMENGKPLPAGRRTPITLEGTRSGERLELTFREKGARRESGGVFVLEIAGDGTLVGTFMSDAANSRGSSLARRSEPAR